MSKFIKVAKDKIMVKVNIDSIGDVWATCTPAVKTFAKTAFKEGDTIKVTYNEQENAQTKYHVTRIEKGTGADTNAGTSAVEASNSGKPKCSDCGKELKDAKYKKCYTCNDKNPAKKGGFGKSVKQQEDIKREAIGHMTSRSLIAMQGQVSPNNVVELMKTIYKEYRELVG